MQIEDNDDYNVQDETFRITSLDKLNWAFRKLKTLQDEERKIKGLAEAEHYRIDSWETRELKPVCESKSYFNRLIENYHFEVLAQDPKDKTISTPYGKSKSRVSRAAPEQADKEEVLKHVLTNGMRDYIKEELRWGDFKKTLQIKDDLVYDSNGEVVPGMIVKSESITFSNEVT